MHSCDQKCMGVATQKLSGTDQVVNGQTCYTRGMTS